MMKILNWILRKYLRKYLSKRVIIVENGKFIPDIEIVEGKGDVLSCYRERIVYELAMEMLKHRLIKIERQRNDEFGGETMTARISIFKFQKYN